MYIGITLDEFARGEIELRVKCPECGAAMKTDRSGQESWNEAPDLCVVTLDCEECYYSGSLHVRFRG